jgi:hypothetical protein
MPFLFYDGVCDRGILIRDMQIDSGSVRLMLSCSCTREDRALLLTRIVFRTFVQTRITSELLQESMRFIFLVVCANLGRCFVKLIQSRTVLLRMTRNFSGIFN